MLFAILIVGLAAAAEEGWRVDPARDLGMTGWPAASVMFGTIALCWLSQWLLTRLSMRRLTQTRNPRYLDVAEYALIGAQWAIITGYALAVLVFGWGSTIQQWLGGDKIVIDLLLTITPAVLGLAGTWWIQEPVVRRLRGAGMIRAIDDGRPVHTEPSRAMFVFMQVRMNILFLLIPLLLIVTARDVIDELVPVTPAFDDPNYLLNEGLTTGAAILVFIMAPLVARLVLNLHRMPAGEIRDDLVGVCRDHRVRVRDVLLWQTHGSMINAAVMGLVGWIRYVMITDALLESLRRDQVIAVMAHEVGHVRRWHMQWLIVCILAVITAPAVMAYGVAIYVQVPWVEDVGMFAALGAAIPAFGWISRRFERQADTFAVQHLSGLRSSGDLGETITPDAADTMTAALESVATLNGMNPKRKSWRHGSIRWRQDYLRTLVGKPIRALPIDRQVRAIKLACLVVFAASIAAGFWLDAMQARQMHRDHSHFARTTTFNDLLRHE